QHVKHLTALTDYQTGPLCYPLLSLMILPPPSSTLFPYTTLFRSKYVPNYYPKDVGAVGGLVGALRAASPPADGTEHWRQDEPAQDRKSTRLNSSHVKSRMPSSA